MNSLSILFLLGLITLVSGFGQMHMAKAGEKVEVKITEEKVKAITRKLDSGSKQTWNVDGPNKGTWVDESGKKIDSKNYSFKAPGTIIINKFSKSDEGLYDYIPLVAPPTPPPGVHVDPSYRGKQLVVQP